MVCAIEPVSELESTNCEVKIEEKKYDENLCACDDEHDNKHARDENVWVEDSGASHHITNRELGLVASE